MELMLVRTTWEGDKYFARNGDEYRYYGNGRMKINGIDMALRKSKQNYSGHGFDFDIVHHHWYHTDEFDKRAVLRGGFTISDDDIGPHFRKVHFPTERKPW